VDIEPCVTPGKKAFCPFRTEELLTVTRKCRWGWKFIRFPNVWMAAMTPGISWLPVETSK